MMAIKRRSVSPGSEVQELASLLAQAEHRLRRALARVLEDEGSTIEQWRTLVLLADGRGHSMSELADHALLPAASLTRLIDRMVAENLAYRMADPADRRRVLVRATSRGLALHGGLVTRIDADRDRILAEADPGEVAQLTALLATLVDRCP